MSRDFPHLAGRLFGVPLLLDPRKVDAIIPAFMRRLNGEPDEVQPSDYREDGGKVSTGSGVAVIAAIGSLVRRKTEMDAWSGLTSYGDIGTSLDSCLEDPRVRAILLQVDSFGGEGSGCFELCDKLYAARGRGKPIWAVADVDALSAGYAILAQADRVLIAPSGSAGSIGVVGIHLERSQFNEAMGYTYTVFRAGLRKAELNSYEPLTKAAAEKVQGSLDKMREMFVASVVRARPGLTARAARATEAQWYDSDDALKLKLVDQISTFDDAFAELALSVALPPQSAVPPPQPPAPIEDEEEEGDDPPEAAAEESSMEPTAPAPATPATPPAPAPVPAPAAPPAAAAETSNVVTIESARAEGRSVAAAEMREIAELCQLAGKPALAAEFIAGGRSVADVKKALIDQRAEEDKQIGELSNHRPAGGQGQVNATAMWDDAFGAARRAHGTR